MTEIVIADAQVYADITETIRQLREALDKLGVRGLYACAETDVAMLAEAQRIFADIGAAYLAERLSRLLAAIRDQNPAAGRALLDCFSSLHVFERLLTREFALATLSQVAEDDD